MFKIIREASGCLKNFSSTSATNRDICNVITMATKILSKMMA